MLRLTLLILLPCTAFAASLLDPKYAAIFGNPKGDEVLYHGGEHNDGYWSCPWHLSGGGCSDGDFECECNDGTKIKFGIGCCYHFPGCGEMCHNWHCGRYRNCATCRGWVSEWDYNSCSSCKLGFVYENGNCDRDLDECANKNGGCDQNCHNTYGSYYCTCKSGYSLNSDKHTCKRLSCPSISETSEVSVTPTDNWLYDSYAEFAAKDTSLTLDGPSVTECLATGVETYWDQEKPVTVDTCNKVKSEDRQRCPQTSEDTSRDACLQRGCCYQTHTDAPSCYLNPTANYIRFGGIGPNEKGQEAIDATLMNHNTKTCTHKCENTFHGTCKSFVIKRPESEPDHDVNLQDCQIMKKSRTDMEASDELCQNKTYDMYESFTMPGHATPYIDEQSTSLDKQYEGCFKDNSSDPDLPYLVMSSATHMDPARCIDLCRKQSHKFAALQNGKDCYCGSTYFRKHGESDSCNVPCSGDASQTCGGQDANSVYDIAWTDSYLGCHNDDPVSRDLPFLVWYTDAGRSAKECMHECTKRNYIYAGLQDGGACYCGNKYGSHGAANESLCSQSCYGYSRQNCGGNTVNAIYQTDLVNALDSGSIKPSVTRLYDSSGSLTGVSTALFTFYPSLRSILSKRLIIHSSTDILTPFDATCSTDCYTSCGDIHHDDRISNKGQDVILRFFFLNLSDLHKYVGTAAKRVFVHAQTIVIDEDIEVKFALSIRAQTIIMDRSRSYFIAVPSDATPFNVDVEEEKYNDPEPDSLHQKQSIMCAKILLDTHQRTNINSAYTILYDIASTSSANKEHQALAGTARNIIAELAGLERTDVHFVPFYTKTHLAKILDNYYERITLYKDKLDELVEGNHQKEQVIDYVEDMHDIYIETDLYEAKTALDASVTAVKRSNDTYVRFSEEYNISRDALEEAQVKFEEGLDEKKGWAIGEFVAKVVASLFKSFLGMFDEETDSVDDAPDGIEVDITELFGLMKELSETIKQIDDLSKVADQVIEELDSLETEFDGIKYFDEIEESVQLQVNIIKWQNLKNYGETLLSQEDVASVRGCADYHRHLLDTCNWGEALTRSMVERSEMIRDAMEKRTILDLKLEQQKRIDDHLQMYKDDLYSQELLIADMVEQSYDVRLDLNEALLTFCQAYFYENMFECKPSYQPSFGGDLDDLLLKINDAKRDDLLVGGAPSTIHRYVDIEDEDTDPLCNDALKCPVNYLRKNRLLYFTLPTDHKDLRDIDAYKVSEIILKFNGAQPSTDNNYLKVQIESSGEFRGRADQQVHDFLTRALTLAFEYDLKSNHITVRADVYKPFRNIIQHITPFTTWVMRVSDARSSDIDLSKVTSVRVQFNGSGVDNETWKQKQKAALS